MDIAELVGVAGVVIRLDIPESHLSQISTLEAKIWEALDDWREFRSLELADGCRACFFLTFNTDSYNIIGIASQLKRRLASLFN
jgi:hypothetical protein